MNKAVKGLSFIVPAYRDEGNLDGLVISMIHNLSQLANRFEIIIVEDCSPDQTGAIADALTKKYPEVSVIHNRNNENIGGSLRIGMEATHYDLVGYVDGDHQFDFDELGKLLTALAQADVVTGYRIHRAESFFRQQQSKIYNHFVNRIFGLNIEDSNCGFKLYRRKVLTAIQPLHSAGGFIDAEMLIKARRKKFKIRSIPVSHRIRRFGRASGGELATIRKTIHELLMPEFKPYRQATLVTRVYVGTLRLATLFLGSPPKEPVTNQ